MDAIRTANALLEECKSLFANAELAGRELNPTERADVKAKLDTVESLKASVKAQRFGESLGTGGDPLMLTDPYASGSFGGWAGLANSINLKTGKLRAKASLESLLRKKDLTGATDRDGYQRIEGPLVQEGRDFRYLYPTFVRQGLSPEQLTVSEWRQTGGRTVTGNVERDPFDTGTKAELDVEVEHVDGLGRRGTRARGHGGRSRLVAPRRVADAVRV
jgi:hypothetical protein